MLTKTKSGNWAKQTQITAGGKWRKCTLHNVPLEVAQAYEATHKNKGRKTRIEKAKKPLADGQDGYQLFAYIAKKKSVMVHASAAECIAAGVKPGKMNE